MHPRREPGDDGSQGTVSNSPATGFRMSSWSVVEHLRRPKSSLVLSSVPSRVQQSAPPVPRTESVGPGCTDPPVVTHPQSIIPAPSDP